MPDLKHSKAAFHDQSSGISACTNTLISCLQISKKLLWAIANAELA